jgi:hypothetical protein
MSSSNDAASGWEGDLGSSKDYQDQHFDDEIARRLRTEFCSGEATADNRLPVLTAPIGKIYDSRAGI